VTLEVTRGDDEALTVVVTDPDAGNALVDLTGVALTWMMKRYHDDADDDALLTKTTSAGITISDQTANKGEAAVAIAAADTDDLVPGLYFWELQSVSGGDVKTLADGRVRVKADLIRGTS
jgi:hypothetical protein